MDVRHYLVLLMFLVSCVPSATVSRGNLANSSGSTTGSTAGGTLPVTATTWNFLGITSSLITINAANLNSAYIVGSQIENFLNLQDSFTKVFTNSAGQDYCLIANFSLAGVAYEQRYRAVPISYFDFTENRTVRVFRIDFQDVTNSRTFCQADLKNLNSDGLTFSTQTYVFPAPTTDHFDPSKICTNCTSILTANRLRFFKSTPDVSAFGRTLWELPTSQVKVSSLNFAVDPNKNSSATNGSCTLSDCRARNYDCCLDNQCVKDGSVRPSATAQFSSQLQLAEQERLQNPMAYFNYPQLYYICGTAVPPTTGGTTDGNYDAGLEQLKKDYACVENIKANSTSTPFHNDLLLLSYSGVTSCKVNPTDVNDNMYYKTVFERLYKTCGCSKTTLSDMIPNCPNYEYTVTLRDTLGNPTRIDCFTPPNPMGPIPSQQTVSMSSRTAPHRFFNASGIEETLKSTSTQQEGPKFEYLDDGKIIPSQQNFSMNAILGQMSVSLDQALPAKSVAVELDQVYMLSTTSGYYTPCPTCSKDSWLATFSAFPTTAHGTGLQAFGHTTERDVFGTNTPTGNYEDTIFGRACWLPPTMIPFSQSNRATVPSQRQNRLETQAALFANGYQRDWFGFNKGALIGSFDGVTWFAIGKGRLVKSTSKKLFLAINAPFADVATPTFHVVNVQAYDGFTQATQFDYDPQFSLSHPYQNEAGNCQANHLCSTDTDCITRLGWEYMCADVKDIKTNWPVFDTDGNEVPNQLKSLTLDQILQQKRYPTSATKRCIYRGSGSMCITSSNSITDLNKRKTLTCAPNFYCASVNAGAVFNGKIARFAGALEDIPVPRNHYFGKDTNVLGRPYSYIASSDSVPLTSGPRLTLIENMMGYEVTGNLKTGLCQPGKALPETATQIALSDPYAQHQAADVTKRTDFISQIGSCNSTLFTANRYASCPVIGSTGDYEMFRPKADATPATDTLFIPSFLQSAYSLVARSQNACGLDSIKTGVSLANPADVLSANSTFRNVEAKPLNVQVIQDATLTRDACLRRAGQVCHTDLDCSPNKMHAAQIDAFPISFFGNEAEKNYYNEFLVCGQTDPKPFPSDVDAFKAYDMSKNRCCREVGSDLTTYTSNVPTAAAGGAYLTETVDLMMSVAPGIAPNDVHRYSRLATVETLPSVDRPILSAYNDRIGLVIANDPKQTANMMTDNQWKTLGEANSETCCGGGWVRKFADGSNDWSRRDRVLLDVGNFRCLNSRTVLITTPQDVDAVYGAAGSAKAQVDPEYGNYCLDATNTTGSCAQYSITDSMDDTLPANIPIADAYGTATINTVKPNFTSTPTNNLDFFFVPKSGDADPTVIMDFASTALTARKNITIKIPSYVPRSSFESLIPASISITLTNDTGAPAIDCFYRPDIAFLGPTDPGTPANCAGLNGGKECCYNFIAGKRTLSVASITPVNPIGIFATKKKAGIQFTFDSAGKGTIQRFKPGSNAYYLKRLGHLELTGIPQMPFEPLYCSDNHERFIPGIFKANLTNRTSFESDPTLGFTFLGKHYTNQFALQTDPVFSPNDFKCCTPLGKTTDSMNKCCSSFGAVDTNTHKVTCSLPVGTDLMVYFNRFVSNEGRGVDQPGGGLIDTDFEKQSGEPLLTAAVNAKIHSLGTTYCENGTVRQGGAFGKFEPEPQGPNTQTANGIYGIVDSPNDKGQNSNAGQTDEAGYDAFMDGFRWNHHLYCKD